MMARTLMAGLLLCCALVGRPAAGEGAEPSVPRRLPPLSDEALLTEVQHRAFRFFWEQSDPQTGLTSDRARNADAQPPPENGVVVASVASTGYALASLPVAVEHHWIGREEARQRALTTLRFLMETLPQTHGWRYHFINRRTGERVWNCELSTIDTCLLMEGVLVCGQYWRGTEVEKRANALYDLLDWTWVRTNGGDKPEKPLVSHGWTPEKGFLPNNWGSYCELMLLYLLGLGAKHEPLPAHSWDAWERNRVEYGGRTTLAAGPIFMHQMAHGYYDFKNRRDRLGWDYWVSSVEATRMNREFCQDHAAQRRTYTEGFWGLNASDGPDGYSAYGVPEPENGTVSPTGMIASLSFTPDLSRAGAQGVYTRLGDKAWGRYGFCNAFNIDRNWFDPDVIGIDLGMALVAIENARTGLIWKLLASHPATQRALQRAGLKITQEAEPRPLYLPRKHGDKPRPTEVQK